MATCRVPDPIAIPDQYKKSFVGLKDLDVFFMVETAKMSPKLRLQKRVLVVLYAQLYSCYDDGNITRQIRIPSISELIVKDLDVVIRVPLDLDLWVRLPDQATVRRLLEVLTSLHFKHIGSPLRVSSVPPQLQLGCTQFPVKLSKPDKLVHLDPVTQHQTPLQRPDDVGSEAETRYKARGSVPPPPSNPPSEGVVMLADPPNAVGYTLPLHLQQQQPPPPPPEEEEEDVDTATGLLTAGNVVVGGDSHYPTVELVETQQDGLTQGVVTLTPEQLASAQGGPIKINLQIMTLNGEPSQVSSRAGSLTPGTTIPPPPSRSASGEPHLPAPTEVPLSEPSPVSESRPASRPASRPVSMVSVAERSEPALVSQFVPPPPPSEPARSEAATSRAAVSQHATPLQPAASQPSVVQPLSQPPLSCHTVSAPTPQQAPVSHVPVSQVSVQVQSHPQPSMQEVPVQAQVSSHDATTQAQPPTAQHTDVQTMHTGGIDERPRVMTETKGVYVRADDGQLRSAAPSVQFKPSPVSLPASALRTPASAALLPADLPESPLGRMVTVEIPNTDGSSQVVQVPEASYPSVEAMVHQILDARESLKKKDQQLSAVLGLTQKSNTLKKERTEERIHELLDRNKETEAELEQLRGELRITKHKVVAEKEAHLNDLAAATAVHERPQPQPQPVVPPSQMANFSPGGRLHRSMPLNSARVSPVRHHGGGGSPHSSRQRKPARQYSHSPVPPVEPESDWAMMSRICLDIGQRLDGTRVTQSPNATDTKRRLVSQFSPLPNLSSPLR